MRTLRLAAASAVLAAALLLTGCFDIEESVELDKNLAGKAGFQCTVDMGAMVLPMLMMKRQMEGKTGDPTPAEVAAARQEMLAQQKTGKSEGPSGPRREEIEKSLPPGVRLLDAGADEGQDMKLRAHFRFGFDDLNKLAQIRDPQKKDEAPGPGKPALLDQPFSNLKLVDEGKTVLVSTDLGNPVAESGPAAGGGADTQATPEQKKQAEQILQGLHLRFKLTTPLQVVESNALRRDGNTLVWDYDLAAIEKLADAKQPVKIWARLRR
jgi:hypothetical protein